MIPKPTLKYADMERAPPRHENDPLAQSDVSWPPPRPLPGAASGGAGIPPPAGARASRAARERGVGRGARASCPGGI